MKRFLLLFNQILLNPRNANSYSHIFHTLNKFAENNKLLLNSLEIMAFYVVALIPLWFSAIMTGANFLNILILSILILGIGFLFGGIHLTFGFVIIVFLSLLNSLNYEFYQIIFSSKVNLILLLVIFIYMPLILLLQFKISNSPSSDNQLWKFVTAIVLFSTAFGLTYFFSNETPNGFFWIILTVVALLLMTNTTKDKIGKRKFDSMSEIAAVIFVPSSIIMFWKLLTFPPSKVGAFFDFIVHLIVTMICFIVLCFITILTVRRDISDEKDEDEFLRQDRLLSFSVFIILLVNNSIWIAFAVAFITFFLYPISFPFVARFNKTSSNFIFIFERTIAAAYSFFISVILITVTNLQEKNWLNLLGNIFAPKLSDTFLSSPLWAFAATMVLFTIFGMYWSSCLPLLIFMLLINFSNKFDPITVSPQIFIFNGSIILGAIIGSTRIFLWPLFSLIFLRLSSKIQKTKIFRIKDNIHIIYFIEAFIWPTPLGKQSLFFEFTQKGVPVSIFQNKKFREKYKFIRIQTIQPKIETIDNIRNIVRIKQKLLTPILKSAIKSFKDGYKSTEQITRIRSYAATIKKFDSIVNEVLSKWPKKNWKSDISHEEINGIKHIINIAYKEIQPAVETYWLVYDAFPKLNHKIDGALHQNGSKDTPISLEEVPSQISQQLKNIENLESKLEPIQNYFNQLPYEEQNYIKSILKINLRIAMYLKESDYQKRTRIVQTSIAKVEEIREKLKLKFLTIKKNSNEIVEHENPWLSIFNKLDNYLKNLSKLNVLYLEWVTYQIATVLKSIHTIGELAKLTSNLEKLTSFGENYGPKIDITLESLREINQEASAAFQFPEGFNRRLGLQDTWEKINQLRSNLSTKFFHEAQNIVDPLDNIANMLHNHLFSEEGIERSTYRNPYLAGNPIQLKRAALFKGRSNLAININTKLRNPGTPTFILHGPRRMGKTSFLLQLPRLLDSKYIPIFIDMQMGSPTQSDASFIYSLANAIYRQMRVKFKISEPNFSECERLPYSIINNWLDEVKPLLGDKSLFITFDEFEVIGKAITQGDLPEKILYHLRYIMQHNDNIILLFAGVETIEALGPNSSSYFINAYPVEISYLDKEEARELICNPDPSAGKMPNYDEEVIENLLRVTHCQPYLIQAICSEIIGIANSKNISKITNEVLNEAMHILLSTSLYFRNIWDDAGNEGRNILKLIAKSSQKLQEDQIDNDVLEGLLRRHVIKKSDDKEYDIEIPLVREWININLV